MMCVREREGAPYRRGRLEILESEERKRRDTGTLSGAVVREKEKIFLNMIARTWFLSKETGHEEMLETKPLKGAS